MKNLKDDDNTKIMVPEDATNELDTILKKYAGVDKLECDKEGYCILQGSQADLECVLEDLGYEDSVKEFEEKYQKECAEVEEEDEVDPKIAKENVKLKKECMKLAKECLELKKECGELEEDDDEEYKLPEDEDTIKENQLLKKEIKELKKECAELKKEAEEKKSEAESEEDKVEEDEDEVKEDDDEVKEDDDEVKEDEDEVKPESDEDEVDEDDDELKESFMRWARESEEEDVKEEDEDEVKSESDEDEVDEEDEDKDDIKEDDEKDIHLEDEDKEKVEEDDEVDEDDNEEVKEEDEEKDVKESAQYKIGKSLKTVIANHSAMRLESIKENLDSQLMETTLFESMDSDNANKMKSIVSEAVNAIVEKSCLAVAKDITKIYETYVNNEVIPSIDKYIQKEVVPSILKKLNTNVDKYLKYVAEEISEDLHNEGMLVYSPKSQMLEDFTYDMLSLIKNKLNIMPKREDALIKAKSHISELNEELQDKSVEYKRMKKAYIETKRENYVLTHMPENISESQKEILVNYAKDELCECVTMSEFRKAFNKACNEVVEINEDVKKPEFKTKKSEKKESISEMLFRLGQ